MKNTVSEMNNTLKWINSRLDEADDQISNLGNKIAENAQAKKKENLKYEEYLRDRWDNMKSNNIYIIGVPEGQEREQGIKNLIEKSGWKLP